jgi:RNA polymerase sigma-70 factor (ECF subfamily)
MIDDIVRRCQKGDERAFHELFHLHGGMIQKIALRMTRNTEWRRDIFQDVVEQVINNIAKFRGECKFTTWLYRITVNAALRFLQREGTYKNMLSVEDEAVLDHTAREGGALSHVERKEMFGHIMAALMVLPREYKDVLSLPAKATVR